MSLPPQPPHDEAETGQRLLRRSLSIALLRAREAVMSHFRPMLANHDISEQQWRVLRVLAETGTLDASELAERAFVLAPSLTRMIRSLEDRGFLLRLKDERDGRRVLLQLAPLGLSFIEEVRPDSRAIYDAIEGCFGRERVDALLDVLEDLAELKAEGTPPRPQGED